MRGMTRSLVIVFGMPGAGKSYVAQVLAGQFGYFQVNGDEALPADMKKKILEKSDVTSDMRTRFVENIIAGIGHVPDSETKIVVHQALIKEHMRGQLAHAYPDAVFIWVRSDDGVLKKRYMKRDYFNLGLAYLQVMIDAFEPPKKPYIGVDNTADGPDEVVRQLKTLGF